MICEMVSSSHQESPLDLANNCFPDDGPVLVNQTGRSDGYVSLRQALQSAESAKAVNLLVDNNSNWIYSFGRLGLYEIPLDDLTLTLSRVLQPIYSLVNDSLSTVDRDFNRHGLEEHVLPVDRRGRSLIRDFFGSGIYNFSFTERRERNLIIAVLTHDIGNLCNRTGHELTAVKILERVLPELTESTDDWLAIKRAITNHDENQAEAQVLPIIHQAIKGEINSQILLAEVKQLMGEEGLVLFVSDKTDVGTRRVGLKAGKQAGVVDNDQHVVANLLMETKSVDYSGLDLRWVLDFTPQPANEQEAEQLSACVRPRSSGNGNRWHVPEAMRNLYRNHGISHFDAAKNRFMNLYFDRIRMAILCGLALTDGGKFELTLRDLIDAGGDGSYYTIKTTQDTLLEWFKKGGFWAKKFFDKKKLFDNLTGMILAGIF